MTPTTNSPMSTTITLTMAELNCCSSCGIGLDAQKQIEDLQAQVRLLSQKATAAVDKWADYEDEIQHLRTSSENARTLEPPRRNSSVPFDERATSPSTAGNLSNRLSSFLSARKSTSNLKTPDTPSTNELEQALKREQNLRVAAEGKLDQASGELEELTAHLFEQANEMVATERKARAKLEERVDLLERRDGEKRKRLERLEGAMARIERVRGLLVAEES